MTRQCLLKLGDRKEGQALEIGRQDGRENGNKKDEKAKMCYRSSEDDMETYGTGTRLKSLCHSSDLPLRSLPS
jgi:hypothetical protein